LSRRFGGKSENNQTRVLGFSIAEERAALNGETWSVESWRIVGLERDLDSPRCCGVEVSSDGSSQLSAAARWQEKGSILDHVARMTGVLK
jgi:hypothetical protein